jgi:multiple antibiotic resistance protein
MTHTVKSLIGFSFLAIPSLLVISNPILATSTFLTLTAGASEDVQHRIARRTAIAAFLVMFAFAVFGTLIFRAFSITIGAFQIAGGVILFTAALGMLQARSGRLSQSPEEIHEALSREDVAIVPLAIPMISGPGAITTVIVLAGDAIQPTHMLVLFFAIVLACSVVYLGLRHASRLQRAMGKTALNVMSRLMGLILAAIAAQFIIEGIKSVLPEIMKAAGC